MTDNVTAATEDLTETAKQIAWERENAKPAGNKAAKHGYRSADAFWHYLGLMHRQDEWLAAARAVAPQPAASPEVTEVVPIITETLRETFGAFSHEEAVAVVGDLERAGYVIVAANQGPAPTAGMVTAGAEKVANYYDDGDDQRHREIARFVYQAMAKLSPAAISSLRSPGRDGESGETLADIIQQRPGIGEPQFGPEPSIAEMVRCYYASNGIPAERVDACVAEYFGWFGVALPAPPAGEA